MGAGEAVSATCRWRVRRLVWWSTTCKSVSKAVSNYHSLDLRPSWPLYGQKQECMLFRNASHSELQARRQW